MFIIHRKTVYKQVIIIIIIYLQGWERAIDTLSVRRPQPHNTDI